MSEKEHAKVRQRKGRATSLSLPGDVLGCDEAFWSTRLEDTLSTHEFIIIPLLTNPADSQGN